MITGELLTPWLLETVQRGEAVLFLGAGASIGARGRKGEEAPSGDKLRDLLCDRFLGGALKTKSLAQVAELAKNEAGFDNVQHLVKELFLPIQPAGFHLLIPTFRWHGIVTTNFDLILERAYAQCTDPEQDLAPVLRDGDNFSDKLRDTSKVVYLKLHGCITQISDENLPLILASEEYAKHRRNRERLFRHFQDWGRERPIIFCGYDIGDQHIQQILFDLADMGIRRPLYAVVNPGLDPISARYWAAKRFAICPDPFQAFLEALDARIPRSSRRLGALLGAERTPLDVWLKTAVRPSSGLLVYLQKELCQLHKGIPTTGVLARDFYRGLTVDWGAFQQELDVRRRVSDDIILNAFLDRTRTKPGQAFVLKGHAGSGKSVSLRRVAWDIAHLFDGFVFWLREGGLLRKEYLEELHQLTEERIYLVVDDAIPHVADALEMLGWSERAKVPVTLILGARTNEWNVHAGELERRVENEFELRDLTEREISQLLDKLGTHRALGRLEKASAEERFDHFKLSAERQLLVALHDISSEKPFEEIVLDEYRNITPAEARILYLDVCTLHRLGVGVRAGLISRISGITFEYFNRDFFRPLEHVVRTYFDYSTRDNMYRSRHRLIAEIVFREALPEAAERAAQITRLIRSMDVDYASDQAAFREMIKGRTLADLFANKRLALQIFDAAEESGASLSYIEHQRAVFETQHPQGNLDAAMEAIERAEAASDHTDRAILHTKATVLRHLALAAPQRLAREKLREQARAILQKQTHGSRVSHPYHMTGQLLIDEIKDRLAQTGDAVPAATEVLQERGIAELLREAEQVISQGLQRFPGDHYLFNLEAELAKLLENEERARRALERAYEVSPGRSFIAVRLANYEERRGNLDKATEILKRSLAVNPVSKEVHLALARILAERDEVGNREEIGYHLKRSFTPGDSNLDAQFWYARHAFLFGDRDAAEQAFRQLSEAWTPLEYRKRVKGVLTDREGARRRFTGWVKTIEDSYCFVHCPELRGDIFAHLGEFGEANWARLARGTAVTFELGFTLRGPVVLNPMLA